MSEIDEPLPIVNVVNKKWVNFDKTNAPAEQMVDGVNEINQNYRTSLEDAAIRSREDLSGKESRSRESHRDETANIHLPPPPRPDRTRKISNKSNQNEPDRLHSRSPTPHLSSSPHSSSANHQQNHSLNAGRSSDRQPTSRVERLAERSADRSTRLSTRQADSDRPASRDECALNIPESFIKTNSANLQNVPLRDLAPASSPTVSQPNSSTAQSSSRFSEYSNGSLFDYMTSD